MVFLKRLIFFISFLSLLSFITNTGRSVINTCGNKENNQPSSAEDCIEEGEICCFVSIKATNNEIIKFCVSSPSDIEKEDVDYKIKEYTGFTIEELHCNKGQFINNYLSSLIFLFILLISNI